MDIKMLLQQAIAKAAEQAQKDGVFQAASIPEIFLEVPPQKEFGD